MIGRGKKESTVFMIDYGLAKKYRTSEGQHMPYEDGRELTGTARYASICTASCIASRPVEL